MLPQVALREVGEADLATVLGLFRYFVQALGMDSPADMSTVELHYHLVWTDPNRCLLGIWLVEPSVDEGMIVGVADAMAGHPEEGWATIGLLVVALEWQRQGVGRQALHALETYLREGFGVRAFRAGVLDLEPTPMAFWLKMGYRTSGITEGYTAIQGVPRDVIWLTRCMGCE